jgi:hypothetical protein
LGLVVQEVLAQQPELMEETLHFLPSHRMEAEVVVEERLMVMLEVPVVVVVAVEV